MTTDQKEKRNDEYNKYVKRVTPTHCLSAMNPSALLTRDVELQMQLTCSL